MSELAKKNPSKNFVFVASHLNSDINDLPPNVILYQDTSAKEFSKLLLNASAVIVPLKEDVGSSGQMLCIQAMRYHKPIIYTNVSCINYYFSTESGIPYKIGDMKSLQSAVDRLYRQGAKNQVMGECAYRQSMKFTIAKRNKMLDDIIFR